MPQAPEGSPAAAALASPENPLRKQTLLGIAPVLPEAPTAKTSEPPTAKASEPPTARISETLETASSEAPAATQTRGKTLLGLAPPIVEATRAKDRAEAPAPVPSTTEPDTSTTEPDTAAAASVPTTSVAPAATFAAPAPTTDAPTTVSVASSSAPAQGLGSDDELPPLQPKRPRWLVPLGVAAALGLGVAGLRQLDRPPSPLPAELARPVQVDKAKAKAAQGVVPEQPAAPSDVAPPSTAVDAPAASAAPAVSAAAPTPDAPSAAADAPSAAEAPRAAADAPGTAPPSSAVTAAPAAEPAPSSATSAAGDGPITIQLVSKPPGARLFWKGKEVGTTPLTLHFQPGEKHAYELGLTGFMTRKVVIDGSKSEISIGLRPDPSAPASAKPRK